MRAVMYGAAALAEALHANIDELVQRKWLIPSPQFYQLAVVYGFSIVWHKSIWKRQHFLVFRTTLLTVMGES